MRLLSQVTSSSCCERNWSTYGNLYSVKKSRLEQSRAEIMVYVHTNLCLIYRQREEWLRGKTKTWDVFPDDMGLDNSVELALTNMDLNDLVLEPVRFDDDDILEGSSSTPADAEVTMDTREEEDAKESNGDHDDVDIDADSDDDYEVMTHESWATYCLEACIHVVVLYFLFLFAIDIAPALPM